LSWAASNSGQTGFVIERAERIPEEAWSSFQEVGTAPANARSFDDGFIEGRTFYRYRVRARYAGGLSTPSNVAQLFVPRSDPFFAPFRVTP
jgi:hypothetical protein